MPQQRELMLLREEMEMLMAERQQLLQVVGAAAAMIANLDSQRLPLGAVEAADILATVVNRLPEETLRDALDAVHAGTGKVLSMDGRAAVSSVD